MKLENKILSLLIENNVQITTKIVELVDTICEEQNKDETKPSDDRFAPDWSNVPQVYKYHAYDSSNGTGYFYAKKPTFQYNTWLGEWVGGVALFMQSGKCLGQLSIHESENSLRVRPE